MRDDEQSDRIVLALKAMAGGAALLDMELAWCDGKPIDRCEMQRVHDCLMLAMDRLTDVPLTKRRTGMAVIEEMVEMMASTIERGAARLH